MGVPSQTARGWLISLPWRIAFGRRGRKLGSRRSWSFIVDATITARGSLKKTGNLKAVMKVMGHKDVKTAMKYQHPEIDIVRAALNQGGSAGRASA